MFSSHRTSECFQVKTTNIWCFWCKFVRPTTAVANLRHTCPQWHACPKWHARGFYMACWILEIYQEILAESYIFKRLLQNLDSVKKRLWLGFCSRPHWGSIKSHIPYCRLRYTIDTSICPHLRKKWNDTMYSLIHLFFCLETPNILWL